MLISEKELVKEIKNGRSLSYLSDYYQLQNHFIYNVIKKNNIQITQRRLNESIKKKLLWREKIKHDAVIKNGILSKSW